MSVQFWRVPKNVYARDVTRFNAPIPLLPFRSYGWNEIKVEHERLGVSTPLVLMTRSGIELKDEK